MSFICKETIKFKLLTFDELVINLDRLSRFKLPELTFKRVFFSILQKKLIAPKYSIEEIENLDAQVVSQIVKKIWNTSVESIFPQKIKKSACNNALRILCKSAFKNTDKNIQKYINTNLFINPILETLDYNTSPINLKFLIKVNEVYKNKNINYNELVLVRKKYSLQFPIRKLIIVEGITEEILLPVFAKKLKHDFCKEGIYIYGAGGKSKSPALYMELRNRLKIPVIILFDADAEEINNILKNNLLKKDSSIVIENGEFEDIISLFLIKRALNKEYLPATPLKIEELKTYKSVCKNIDNFYKKRNLGEYKKSKVSKIIAKNVKYKSDISENTKELIKNLL